MKHAHTISAQAIINASNAIEISAPRCFIAYNGKEIVAKVHVHTYAAAIEYLACTRQKHTNIVAA